MENLIIEQLNSKYFDKPRTIRIYLPKKLENGCHILYFQDGQNIFEDKTSYSGVSWGVIEALNELDNPNVIVVGIDNTENRFDEYSPWGINFSLPSFFEHQKLGGKGSEYAKFVIEELLPYIENKFPQIDKTKRYIVGSSLGAFISIYLALEFPKIFQKVGVLSLASFVASEDFHNWLNKKEIDKDLAFFVSVGTNEVSDEQIKDFPKIYLKETSSFVETLKRKNIHNINYKIIKNGTHHESEWRKLMPEFIKWCLSETN